MNCPCTLCDYKVKRCAGIKGMLWKQKMDSQKVGAAISEGGCHDDTKRVEAKMERRSE